MNGGTAERGVRPAGLEPVASLLRRQAFYPLSCGRAPAACLADHVRDGGTA